MNPAHVRSTKDRSLILFSISLALFPFSSETTRVKALDADNQLSKPPTYEQDIRPILKANCFDCHGESEQLEGGLDLRLRRFILKGGKSGPAIVPNQPEASLLLSKVRSGEMPKREKKLHPEQIALLEEWIALGAQTAGDEPDTVGKGMLITPEERAHWAFQPIRRPAIPETQNTERIRTPVDAFIQAELDKQTLAFSADASPVTLVRRAHIDLIGLPPTPEDVKEFVNDSSPRAYERLIDRLLSSPHYGERWARHWLDVAGYADSNGYTEADTIREYAYKYRDYVVRALNADKPIDEFIHEQLAGDELAAESYTNREESLKMPQVLEKLTATGFLRMGPDGTGGGGVDQEVARNQVVADTIKIVSTSLLGLTVGCAQCHDHRYDPIPQTDYYRLRAVFEPAYDWKNWRNPPQRLISLYTEEGRAKAAAIEKEAKALASEKEKKQKKYIAEALDKHLESFDPGLRDALRGAVKTAAGKRSDDQRKLLQDHPSVNISPGVLYQYNQKAADELKAMDAKVAEIRAKKPPEDFIRALTEVPGRIPATYLFHRGDPKQPKDKVQPGALSVLAAQNGEVGFPEKKETIPTTGRRLAFAGWLTSPENPLLARILVNRIWMHHFGKGLVGTPADFGITGDRPTHPELLDWLASVFSARSSTKDPQPALGWSLKRLHKLIMCSTVYRQSSVRNSEMAALDPENKNYWRKPVQRLDAEAIRDSMLAVSGSINRKMFGQPVPVRENLVGQVVVGVDKKKGDNKMPVDVPMNGEEFRRSVYIQVRRSRPLAFLSSFDAPTMELNCERRQNSTVAPQALMLMNSDFALDQAGAFAKRLSAEGPSSDRGRLKRAWELAFARQPTQEEIAQSEEFLAAQIDQIERQRNNETPNKDNQKKDKNSTRSKLSPQLQAWTDLCQALLGANEFLYLD